ncbi:MAG: hypothetical protein QM804_12235 [Propionicimonas sp.]
MMIQFWLRITLKPRSITVRPLPEELDATHARDATARGHPRCSALIWPTSG